MRMTSAAALAIVLVIGPPGPDAAAGTIVKKIALGPGIAGSVEVAAHPLVICPGQRSSLQASFSGALVRVAPVGSLGNGGGPAPSGGGAPPSGPVVDLPLAVGADTQSSTIYVVRGAGTFAIDSLAAAREQRGSNILFAFGIVLESEAPAVISQLKQLLELRQLKMHAYSRSIRERDLRHSQLDRLRRTSFERVRSSPQFSLAVIERVQAQYRERRAAIVASVEAIQLDLDRLRADLHDSDQMLVTVLMSRGRSDHEVVSIADIVAGSPLAPRSHAFVDPERGRGEAESPFGLRILATLADRIPGTPLESFDLVSNAGPVGLTRRGPTAFASAPLFLTDRRSTAAASSERIVLPVGSIPEFPDDPATLAVPPAPGPAGTIAFSSAAEGVCLTLQLVVPGFVFQARNQSRPADHAVVQGLRQQFILYYPASSSDAILLDDGENDTNRDGIPDLRDTVDLTRHFLVLGDGWPAVSHLLPETEDGPGPFHGAPLIVAGNTRLRVASQPEASRPVYGRTLGPARGVPAMFLSYTSRHMVILGPFVDDDEDDWVRLSLDPAPGPQVPEEPLPFMPPLPFVIERDDGTVRVDAIERDEPSLAGAPAVRAEGRNHFLLDAGQDMTDEELSRFLSSWGLWAVGTVRPFGHFQALRLDERPVREIIDAIGRSSGEGGFPQALADIGVLPGAFPVQSERVAGLLARQFSDGASQSFGFNRDFERLARRNHFTRLESNWHHFLIDTFAGERLALQLLGKKRLLTPITIAIVDSGLSNFTERDDARIHKKVLVVVGDEEPDRVRPMARATPALVDRASKRAADTVEPFGHGTGVAGLIASRSGDKDRVHGLGSPFGASIQLRIVKIGRPLVGRERETPGDQGKVSIFRMLGGLFFLYHSSNKEVRIPRPDVVSISWGGYATSVSTHQTLVGMYLAAVSFSPLIEKIDKQGIAVKDRSAPGVVRKRMRSGVVISIAAGNAGGKILGGGTGYFPAAAAPVRGQDRGALLERQINAFLGTSPPRRGRGGRGRPRVRIQGTFYSTNPFVLAVGATGLRSRRAMGGVGHRSGSPIFSVELPSLFNYGPQVSLAGPGEGVVVWSKPDLHSANARSRAPEGQFLSRGTSLAAPVVSAVVAHLYMLERASGGRLTALQLLEMVLASAEQPGTPKAGMTWHADRVGHGRVNLWKAVLAWENKGKADQTPQGLPLGSLPIVGHDRTVRYGLRIRTSHALARFRIHPKTRASLDVDEVNDPEGLLPLRAGPGRDSSLVAYQGVVDKSWIPTGRYSRLIAETRMRYLMRFSVEKRRIDQMNFTLVDIDGTEQYLLRYAGTRGSAQGTRFNVEFGSKRVTFHGFVFDIDQSQVSRAVGLR